MPVYWTILASTVVAGLICGQTIQTKNNKNSVHHINRRDLGMWICGLTLLLFCGFRDRCQDTYTYIMAYDNLQTGRDKVMEVLLRPDWDGKGWAFLQIFFKTYISDSHYAWFFLIGGITIFCFFYAYHRYSCNLSLTLYLFIASTTFVWLFNGIRQFLAISILFAFQHLLLDGKKWKYIIVVLVVSSFHMTAMIMLPIAFMVETKKVVGWKTVGLAAVMVGLLTLSERAVSVINILLGKDYALESVEGGSNFVRFVIACIPLVIVFMSYNLTKKIAEGSIVLAINMSFIGAAFTFVSTFTNGILVGRIPMFFTVYNWYLLPWLVEHNFSAKSKMLVKVLCISLYLVYFWYQMYVAWGGLYYRSDFLGLYS